MLSMLVRVLVVAICCASANSYSPVLVEDRLKPLKLRDAAPVPQWKSSQTHAALVKETSAELPDEARRDVAFAVPPISDSKKLLRSKQLTKAKNSQTRPGDVLTLEMKSDSKRFNPFNRINSFLKSTPIFKTSMFSSSLGFTGWSGFDLSPGDGAAPFPLFMADAAGGVTPPPKGTKKRILFLMSDTGGGHKASAKAIIGALDLLYPGKFECEIKDIWTDEGAFPVNKLVPIYQFAAKNPWSWRAIYYSGEFPPSRAIFDCTTALSSSANFEAYFQAFNPDIVVSVHPLCQTLPLNVLKRLGGGVRKVPFVTVITDLGSCSGTWFNKEVDKLCVPGDRIEELALQAGVRPYQIRKYGLPVRKGFWSAGETKKKGSKALRKQLGLDEEKPTVLVVGGGDGVGGLKKVAEAVGDSLKTRGEESQLVVVCGKNEKVENALSARKWGDNVHVTVKGFVSDMDSWMLAADCLVTKAGPGTIAEATIVGLPTLLSGFLPGQEAGNVGYVVDGGFGAFEREPAKIGATVGAWLDDKTKLAAMSALASQYGKQHSTATKEIAAEIASMIE